MKKMIWVALAVLVASVFVTALTLSGSLAFAADKCPPGSSCSENYILTPNNVGVVAKPEAIMEKKGPSPEEVAAYQKQVEEAIKRDNDFIRVFKEKSLSESCYSPSEMRGYYDWLIKNPEIVVDKKEITFSHFLWGTGEKRTGCTVMMVVHYHKNTTKK